MGAANAIRAGRAFIELSLHDSPMIKGINAMSTKLRRLGSEMQALGGRMVGLGIAFAAPFAYAVKAAAEFEATLAKFNVVFAEGSKAMMQWSDDLALSLGRSKSDVAKWLAATQDLFVPLGFERGRAAELSKQLVQLGLDVAAFNKRADSDVIMDMQRALVGAHRVMLKYGVVINEANIAQEALNMGFDPKTINDQQKALARLSIIVKGTTDAQGAAIRMGNTFDGTMKKLRGSVENLAGDVGAALLPGLSKFGEIASNIAKQINLLATNNADMVRQLALAAAGFTTLGAAIAGVGIGLSVLSPFGAAAIGLGILAARTIDFGKAARVAADSVEALNLAIKSGDWETAGELAAQSFQYAFDSAFNDIRRSLGEFLKRGGMNFTGSLMTEGADIVDRELRLVEERLKGVRNRLRLEAQRADAQAARHQQMIEDVARWRDRTVPDEERRRLARVELTLDPRQASDPFSTSGWWEAEMQKRNAQINNFAGKIGGALRESLSERLSGAFTASGSAMKFIKNAWTEITLEAENYAAQVKRGNDLWWETATPIQRLKRDLEEARGVLSDEAFARFARIRKREAAEQMQQDIAASVDVSRGVLLGGTRAEQVFTTEVKQDKQLKVSEKQLEQLKKINEQLRQGGLVFQ